MWRKSFEMVLSYLILELRTAINQFYRRGWSQEYINTHIRGLIYITDLDSGAQQFLNENDAPPAPANNDRYLSMRGGIAGLNGETETTGTVFVEEITTALLLQLIDNIQQSNSEINIFRLEFTFIADPNTLTFGNGAPRLPKWLKVAGAKDPPYKQTWLAHTYNGVTLNCAAYSIAYKMASPNQRNRQTWVYRKAWEIMKDLNWYKNVSVFDILHAVKTYFKEYRITVVYLQQYNQGDRTAEGPDYVYEDTGDTTKMTKACNDKTIYLIYDPEAEHYGGCVSPMQHFYRH